jgi:hypothetical protein
MPYFSKIFDYKKRRFKTNLTLILILQFNLRLGGYSIWSAISSHPIQKKTQNYSGHEHLIASRQPKKYSKDAFKMEFQTKPKIASEELKSLQYSATKSSGAYQTLYLL